MNWDLLLSRYGRYVNGTSMELERVIREEDNLAGLSALRELVRAMHGSRLESSNREPAGFLLFPGVAADRPSEVLRLLQLADARVKTLLGTSITDVTATGPMPAPILFADWEQTSSLSPLGFWLNDEPVPLTDSEWASRSSSFLGRAVLATIPVVHNLRLLLDLAEKEAARTYQLYQAELPRAAYNWARNFRPDDSSGARRPGGLHFVTGIASPPMCEIQTYSSIWAGGRLRQESRTARACVLPWTMSSEEVYAGHDVPAEFAMDRRAAALIIKSGFDDGLWETNSGEAVRFSGGGLLAKFGTRWVTTSPDLKPKPNHVLSLLTEELAATPARMLTKDLARADLVVCVSAIGNVSQIAQIGDSWTMSEASALDELQAARRQVLFGG